MTGNPFTEQEISQAVGNNIGSKNDNSLELSESDEWDTSLSDPFISDDDDPSLDFDMHCEAPDSNDESNIKVQPINNPPENSEDDGYYYWPNDEAQNSHLRTARALGDNVFNIDEIHGDDGSVIMHDTVDGVVYYCHPD